MPFNIAMPADCITRALFCHCQQQQCTLPCRPHHVSAMMKRLHSLCKAQQTVMLTKPCCQPLHTHHSQAPHSWLVQRIMQMLIQCKMQLMGSACKRHCQMRLLEVSSSRFQPQTMACTWKIPLDSSMHLHLSMHMALFWRKRCPFLMQRLIYRQLGYGTVLKVITAVHEALMLLQVTCFEYLHYSSWLTCHCRSSLFVLGRI